MKKLKLKVAYFLLLGLLPLFLMNCATSSHNKGMRHLKNNEFTEAIALLKQAEKEKPDSYKIKRDLGIAFTAHGASMKLSPNCSEPGI